MIDVKIEKAHKSLWWPWSLIVLVAAVGLVWLFVSGPEAPRDGQGAEMLSPTDEESLSNDMREAVASNGAPITDLAAISASGRGMLVGRDVELTNVLVGEVTGHNSFWVNGADGARIYVVLDNAGAAPEPTELDTFDKGDRIDVNGKFYSGARREPSNLSIGSMTELLPPGVDQYIFAEWARPAIRG